MNAHPSSLSDRELIELAAKAAGIELVWPEGAGSPHLPRTTFQDTKFLTMPVFWNPLANDGDALRLAVKLDFCVGKAVQAPQRFACPQETDDAFYVEEGGDPAAATRRAIVLAAASLAK